MIQAWPPATSRNTPNSPARRPRYRNPRQSTRTARTPSKPRPISGLRSRGTLRLNHWFSQLSQSSRKDIRSNHRPSQATSLTGRFRRTGRITPIRSLCSHLDRPQAVVQTLRCEVCLIRILRFRRYRRSRCIRRRHTKPERTCRKLCRNPGGPHGSLSAYSPTPSRCVVRLAARRGLCCSIAS